MIIFLIARAMAEDAVPVPLTAQARGAFAVGEALAPEFGVEFIGLQGDRWGNTPVRVDERDLVVRIYEDALDGQIATTIGQVSSLLGRPTPAAFLVLRNARGTDDDWYAIADDVGLPIHSGRHRRRWT